MFCMYCGYNIEPTYSVCPNCRAILEQNNNNSTGIAVAQPEPKKKGKDITSLILGIIGIYYCLILLTSYSSFIEENMELFLKSKISATIGCILVPAGFGLASFLFALKARKIEKNNMNLASLVMFGANIVACIIIFVSIMSYQI